MDESHVTRRDAIKKAAFAGIFLPLVGAVPGLRAGDAAPGPDPAKPHPLELGIATYSLRKLSTDAAVEALKAMEVTSVSVFRVHVPILLSTPEVCRDMAGRFRAAGIAIRSTGVVQLANDEAVMRKAFECGKAAGLTLMTASYAKPPDRETFLLTERFVKEYDMRLAFHNHGPEDAIFPSPYDVWNAVQPYDERLGLCIDVGHSNRAGVDPTEAILKCHSRLYDVHIKDSLAGIGDKKDRPVIMGLGKLDIRSIMSALLKVGFKGQVGLEYEVDSPDPVPGVAQSFGYMRGMLAGLAPTPS
jgi:sugar phosphate isomerase/epimerase